MAAISPILGAPGIYVDPRRAAPALGGVRLDVCGFVGVAPRGPAREPAPPEGRLPDGPTLHLPRRRSVAVPVESFDEYRRLFGGFEGPGRLPFAVASFFAQGGRRAYVVRVVHDYGDAVADAAGVARGTLAGATPSAGTLDLVARSEGTWGNRLRAVLGYTVRPLPFRAAAPTDLVLDPEAGVPAGTLLRLTLPGGVEVLRFVATPVRERRADGPGSILRAVLAVPVAQPPERAEVVEGELLLDDGTGRRERYAGAGLSAQHPRWLATVLCHRSELVFPDASWVDADVMPDAATPLEPPVLEPPDPRAKAQFQGGVDRWADLVPEDFFDPRWTPGDDEPGSGIQALALLPDLASLVVPDLYVPEPLAAVEEVADPISLAGPEFAPCVDLRPASPARPEEGATQDLSGLALDPRNPTDLEAITVLQERLVAFADERREFVVLLDVPPGLDPVRVERWRTRFRSSWAAAYHPWLRVARPDDRRRDPVLLNPSAVGAGILAYQERVFGIPHGPANRVAVHAVDVGQRLAPAHHDVLHQAGVNVFLAERDGIVLTAARTLSADPRLRQLTVRRLLLMLRRTLQREMQWVVFEPNGPALWSELRTLLRAFLRRLYRAGAFRGGREEEAFFVRCDASINPPRVVDAGRVVVEIGVAPSEPVEFLVLRLTGEADGTLAVEE